MMNESDAQANSDSGAAVTGESFRAPVRVVTAASLFDGHDAAINIMRRLLQTLGAEVIHLGHDRSVEEIVEAAVEEAADAVAISSYQGGHLEFFEFLVQSLAEAGVPHVRVYGGGGGTITPSEIERLHRAGVARIFSPDDGRVMGLEGMIASIVDECLEARAAQESDPVQGLPEIAAQLAKASPRDVAQLIRFFEDHGETHKEDAAKLRAAIAAQARKPAPVIGFTGTGGAGKSSVVDELVMRLRRDAPEMRIGMLLVDPTRRRSGGALLGDRIRMNAIGGDAVFVRSMATRQANRSLSAAVGDGLSVLRSAGFDLIFLETAGIGQSDSEIVDQVDLSLYVMTPDYGAPSQLEKIDMIDFADLVVLNKCDRHGAADSLRDIRKQWRRNHGMPQIADEAVPVFPTVARNWNDTGTENLAKALEVKLVELGLGAHFRSEPEVAAVLGMPESPSLVPGARQRYLAEIAESIRAYRGAVEESAEKAALADGHARVLGSMNQGPGNPLSALPAPNMSGADAGASAASTGAASPVAQALAAGYAEAVAGVDAQLAGQIRDWPKTRAAYAAAEQSYAVRNRSIEVKNHVDSLAGTPIPK
ncbi:MAG: cobalamin-dependent protein, partial [Myxococcota bacterium]